MKISYNWLKTLLTFQHSPEEIAGILTATGLEVEHIEAYESVRGGLRGLVVGEVRECIKHPNADKLSLCKVYTGNETLLPVICGAPNVREGIKAVFAPVGTKVHPTAGEPFVISKSKIRGEYSEGMLCSEDEIGLGTSHEGLLILPLDAVPGQKLTELFPVQMDYILEIGLTANRGDAASHTGIARELATVLNIPFEPVQTSLIPDSTDRSINIYIKDHASCPRYTGLILENVNVGESPVWLRNRLESIGLRQVNTVVDITNYILHETGQPLHAFDLDKIKGNLIKVEKVPAGTGFITLDGTSRTLNGSELMICDEAGPICMAGIYGGKESGVSESTTRIFLESAYFRPDTVRKAARHHGLATDSSFRFERGTDPEMCIPALRKAAMLLKEYAGANIVSEIFDVSHQVPGPAKVSLRYGQINRVTGAEIPLTEVKRILTGLGITITSESDEILKLDVPAFKSDVNRETDVIEEVIRIAGFDKIPLKKDIHFALQFKKPDASLKTAGRIAKMLQAEGFREIMCNSLGSDRFYPGQDDLVKLNNPLSAEMNVLRKSMLFGGLEAVAYNKNRKQLNIRFFEFGKIYRKSENGFNEKEILMLMVSGNRTDESWEEKVLPADGFYLKSLAGKIGKMTGCRVADMMPLEATAGELAAFGLKDKVWYMMIDWKATSDEKEIFDLKPIPQFPVVRRDLSLVLGKSVPYSSVQRIIEKKGGKTILNSNVFDVYEGKPLESGQRSLSISLELYNENKTMSDAEIEPVMQALIAGFEKELHAIIRR